MPNTNSLETAITTLREQHSAEVLDIAVMVGLSKHLLQHYAASTGVDLSRAIKTLDKCVESHLIDRDIHPRHLQEALQAVQSAGIASARP